MEFGNKQGEDIAMNGRSRIHHFEGASGSTHKIIYICIEQLQNSSLKTMMIHGITFLPSKLSISKQHVLASTCAKIFVRNDNDICDDVKSRKR